MLILTRKTNEEILIGGEIVLKVIEINGDQVKLGIEAPREVDIHRKEVFAAIQRENSEAAGTPSKLLEQLGKQLKTDKRPNG
ncbi:MAG TPA: carbon storage regulator CsrA [Bacillales bacterium]|nr:carbon storage regulator CsrA [Bacillales bacterium]